MRWCSEARTSPRAGFCFNCYSDRGGGVPLPTRPLPPVPSSPKVFAVVYNGDHFQAIFGTQFRTLRPAPPISFFNLHGNAPPSV